MNEQLDRALELHRGLSGDLLRTAEQIDESRWREPVAEGKWSPSELLEHLNMAYDVLLGELDGRPGMKILTKPWQRFLLRLRIVPRIMKSGRFPRNARAPKEIRPLNAPDREPALAAFRDRATRLEAAARAARPDKKLTHAYFGTSTVANTVILCARHIQHHERQLSGAADSQASV